MLRIVILPAAVSPANIISQKPRGFSITFRIGKYHSGQSPEYHFFVHRRSKHRILSAKIRYLSVFRSYRRQHKFCTAFFLMKPLRRAFFVRHASVGALQGPGCPLPAPHRQPAQVDDKTVMAPDLSLRGPEGAVAISGRQLRFRRWLSHIPIGYCEIAPQGHFLALRAQGATSAFGLLAMTNLGALRH